MGTPVKTARGKVVGRIENDGYFSHIAASYPTWVWPAAYNLATYDPTVWEQIEGCVGIRVKLRDSGRVYETELPVEVQTVGTSKGTLMGVPAEVFRRVDMQGGTVPKAKASKNGGLSAKSFKGLNPKRMEKKGTGGKRLIIKQGDTAPVQFLGVPDNPEAFLEFDIHNFQEDGRWEYVPCAGDNCPLCEDEDDRKSKTSYRFCTNIYDLKDRKVKILEGPKDLAGRIWYRWDRKKPMFLKRTWDISKMPTQPVSYDVERGEDDLVVTKGLKPYDLQEYIDEEMKRYFGDDFPTSSPSALEDEEELEDDDLEEDEDEELEDDDDELEDDDDDDEDDEEDEDDDWEDDDEDEDEPPVKSKAKAKAKAKPKARAKRK